MTIEELRDELRKIKAQQDARKPGTVKGASDPAVQHMRADEFLLDFINDEEVTRLFRSLTKWYS
jgi:hypothetical protein